MLVLSNLMGYLIFLTNQSAQNKLSVIKSGKVFL